MAQDEIQQAEKERLKKEEEEAARWMGLISVEKSKNDSESESCRLSALVEAMNFTLLQDLIYSHLPELATCPILIVHTCLKCRVLKRMRSKTKKSLITSMLCSVSFFINRMVSFLE
jgi:hypothetical protein